MKKILVTFIALLIVSFSVVCANAATVNEIEALRGTTLYVYNWGEYISDGADGTLDVNKAFEEKYGINVVYDTFDNNESMYSKVKSGGVSYDVVIPSEYMIQRMIVEGMLEKLDYSNIPNFEKYIPEKYLNPSYDPKNEYSVPYTVGMVGLIYNSAIVDGTPDSWSALWDKQYKGQILMFNNPRDAFGIAQNLLGMDYNTESVMSWKLAAELLKEQKQISPVYVNDEIFLKMESGEAALGAYYAGDFLTMKDNNPDLEFVYPKEGTNYFVDAICVLKGAKNKLAAELYINFLLEPDVALANAEYICYASPHSGVYTNPEYSFYGNEILYPEDGKFKTQSYLNLSPDTLELMSSLWDDVKNYNVDEGGSNYDFFFADGTLGGSDSASDLTPEGTRYLVYIIIFVAFCIAYVVFRYIRKKIREKA